MTNIHLHGVLTESFPSLLRVQLRKISDATQALDAICDGFRLKIIELAKMGIHYALVVDDMDVKTMEELQILKEPREVHFVPMICGTGAIALLALGGLITWGGASVGSAVIIGGITGTMVAQFGLLVAGIGLQMLLAPKPKNERPESAVSGLSESSFVGASSANLMAQGSPLPLGYGRLRVGSAVINVTTKSFQANLKTNKAMLPESDDGAVGSVQVAIKQGNKTR